MPGPSLSPLQAQLEPVEFSGRYTKYLFILIPECSHQLNRLSQVHNAGFGLQSG